ncbi:MAG TPA: TIGR03621 family F420-dependent LLM class oxidoreductase [Thermomicrobiales bacterium]|jgi:probable F420-dependent oxidoreductase|nr:TIGR03621 family F420-dependent LLM class oxidoreductase [Thermomicrobiales bacterium]
MPRRNFRFGVQITRGTSRPDWQDKARRAEAAGYDVLATVDHFTDVFAWGPAIVSAAAVTETLRFCPYVLANDFRHPALLGQEAATVDILSDGRLELGLGAGWLGSDYQRSGIAFEAPGVRVGKLFESVRILKRYFTKESVTFDGKHYQVEDLPGNPKPVQRPHPPLILGGGGPRILSFAAREADIVGLIWKSRPDGSGFDRNDGSPDGFDQKVATVREAAGERFDGLEFNVLLERFAVTDGAAATRAEVDRMAEQWGVPPETVEASPVALIGSQDEIVEKMLASRDRYGITYYTVRAPDLDDFARIMAAVRGR